MDAAKIQSELTRLKALQAKLLLEKEQLINENYIFYWQPNSPKQWKFFENAGKKRRGVFAGNRFGKSTIGVAEDCAWLLGYRPWYPEGHPLRTQGIPKHGVKGIVIAEDWDKVREIFTDDKAQGDRRGKFFQFLPKDCIRDVKRNSNGVIETIYVESQRPDGSTRMSQINFDTVKSFKMSGLSQESSDWDFAHFDEPVPEGMFKAITRGFLDRGGCAWFLLTALREPWIYNMFAENDGHEEYWHVLADADDNPCLDESAKALFYANLTPEEIECRKKGIPLAFSNLVYPSFDKDKHKLSVFKPHGWDSPIKPSRDWLVTVSIDPHPQTPMAVLFTAVKEDYIIFYDEIFEKLTPSELAELVLEKIKGVRVDTILCDPSAWIKDPETGLCWADYMAERGLFVQKATKEKTLGIAETAEIFKPNFPRKVRYAGHLRRWVKEIANYFYDKENKPMDKDDHLMECMYRAYMHNKLRWYPETDLGNNTASVANVDELQFDDFKTDYSL